MAKNKHPTYTYVLRYKRKCLCKLQTLPIHMANEKVVREVKVHHKTTI